MLKQVSIFLILVNSIILSQSEKSFISKEPSFPINNDSPSPLLPLSQLQVVNIPSWPEVITKVPLNIYKLASETFSGENFTDFGILSTSTALLIISDARSHRFIKIVSYKNQRFNNIEKSIIYLGDGKTNFGISGLFVLYGLTVNDNIALRTGMQSAEAILSTGLTVQLLKRITGRESPQKVSSGSGIWRFFPNIIKYQRNQSKYYSFPSGHLSTAITTLTVIAENYPESYLIKPVGYSLAGLLSVSLVSRDMHWFSDFPLAFALGYGFGKIITESNFTIKGKKESSNSVSISFMPFLQHGQSGVSMLMSF
jgi:membrane-associated phospholipid phosphatase